MDDVARRLHHGVPLVVLHEVRQRVEGVAAPGVVAVVQVADHDVGDAVVGPHGEHVVAGLGLALPNQEAPVLARLEQTFSLLAR